MNQHGLWTLLALRTMLKKYASIFTRCDWCPQIFIHSAVGHWEWLPFQLVSSSYHLVTGWSEMRGWQYRPRKLIQTYKISWLARWNSRLISVLPVFLLHVEGLVVLPWTTQDRHPCPVNAWRLGMSNILFITSMICCTISRKLLSKSFAEGMECR